MYLANHNLNTAIDISAILGNGGDETILIPNTASINNTNGEYLTTGQLGAMAANCSSKINTSSRTFARLQIHAIDA